MRFPRFLFGCSCCCDSFGVFDLVLRGLNAGIRQRILFFSHVSVSRVDPCNRSRVYYVCMRSFRMLDLTYIKVAQLKRKLLDVIMPKDPLSSS